MINNKWVIYIEKRNKKKSSHPGEKCFLHSLARKQRYNFIPLHRVKSVRIRSYSELHFSRIRTEYGAIPSTEYPSVFSPNAGKCGKNADQNNSEYGLFLRSICKSIKWFGGIRCMISLIFIFKWCLLAYRHNFCVPHFLEIFIVKKVNLSTKFVLFNQPICIFYGFWSKFYFKSRCGCD